VIADKFIKKKDFVKEKEGKEKTSWVVL